MVMQRQYVIIVLFPPVSVEEEQPMSRDAYHAGSNVALTATISIVRQRDEATSVSANRWACGSVT